ncbi:methyltransferase domain-containing protein [Erwinia sp. CPCC 100877]|nr:methyltransferase domain-containing protein [Erwinia sp. CPCC 100877]
MKPARIPDTIAAPECWAELPWGEYYRDALEQRLQPWLAKMFGFHLIKVGNLSAEIATDACAISHQINLALQGRNLQVMADPLHLPFASDSVDACLLAHTLSWCQDPHRLLREVDRILIDDGWLILSSFNPISLVGLRKLAPFQRRRVAPWNSRMFPLARQLDWLSLLNFEVLHQGCFQVLPWSRQGGKILSTHLPALGCLQLIVARKRTIPLILNPMKQRRGKTQLRPAVGATRQCRVTISSQTPRQGSRYPRSRD